MQRFFFNMNGFRLITMIVIYEVIKISLSIS